MGMENQKDIRVIHIGSDHAGYEMKEELKKFLEMKDFKVIDHGAYEYNEFDDYPDFCLPVAVEVSQDEHSVGIVLGGSGQGEAMVANRVPGIRATVFYGNPSNDENMVVLSKQHNDSNILSLGARFLTIDEAKEAVDSWLETAFSNEERHVRRINKIENLDSLMIDENE
jgi:ribose 5-phosphate isomerase B